MYIVAPVTTFRVYNDQGYTTILDNLDEITANKIATGMNNEFHKMEVKHNAEISKLSQPVDVSTFTLPNS